jgi:hypothetical protein
VPAHGGGAAAHDGGKRSQLPAIDAGMSFYFCPVFFQYISYLEAGPHG